MPPPLLTLHDTHLTFGGAPLLEGAELSIGERERACLVGRNGSGKSTLLKIAAGLAEADHGVRFVQPGATIRYLPQEPDLTGYPNVLGFVAAGLAPGDDAHRARYLLEQLGLTGAEDTAQLSGGEARRAALARALAPEPDILLLDEPTNHLDLPAIEWLESELAGSRFALAALSRKQAGEGKHYSSSPNLLDTSASSASTASRACAPVAEMVIELPSPAPSIISPMMELPETVSSPRLTLIDAVSLNCSTTTTNFADARACSPFSLTMLRTRVTAPESDALPSDFCGALISRQARDSQR